MELGWEAGLAGSDPRSNPFEKLSKEWREWNNWHAMATELGRLLENALFQLYYCPDCGWRSEVSSVRFAQVNKCPECVGALNLLTFRKHEMDQVNRHLAEHRVKPVTECELRAIPS